MFKARLHAFRTDFTHIFNFRDEDAKGRSIELCNIMLAAFFNVFITGIFYTGFLTMYGMSITDAGVITFIPFIGNLFNLFSPKVLAKFKRRKPILLAAKLYFYFMYIVATNLMPLFVTDTKLRLLCFSVILFLAYSVYGLFSPGFTTWFYRFYPTNRDMRSKHVMYQQIFSALVSGCVVLFSSILTDAVSGSPYQSTLILGLRYFAFGLIIVDVIIQSRAKEYPVQEEPSLRLRHVVTLPFRYPKFIRCMALMFSWNFISNLPNGLWNYHLLNHLHFSYTMINLVTTVMYTVFLTLFAGAWRKVLRRFSWVKTFGLSLALYAPTEIFAFLLTPDRAWLYILTCVIQNLICVGMNLSYGTIFYINLPEENSTAHIAFYSVGCNLFASIGLLTGTWISSISGDNTILFLGMEVYSVQLIMLLRVLLIGVLGTVLFTKWRIFTKQEEIDEIEAMPKLFNARVFVVQITRLYYSLQLRRERRKHKH